ncbi:endolytic transglycosylase MltG [Fredinandcohnia quinoae]|uniref:Endolytic transglycosylase MltG n=1 Tax=Fredinandcohnia quinoae TaxID=2918902 RepID=A0AAW5DYI3_9BACI|nr:endolytic transglycosylase MltG [Fredinandcohnia sp. SECRCQ15]MCH1625697.1 endolytic transglycosylase MltG [Fredinandcohnia sp. SECRCQ15]
MNVKSLRSFAGGLILATCICGAAYFFGPNENPKSQAAEKPTVEEMKKTLTSEGYVIHTDQEWKDQLAATNKANVQAEEPKKEAQEKVVYRTMLTVTEGMTSIDVGKALAKANIIENSLAFTNEVEKKGVSKYLRPGTYEIQSDMKTEEVISTLFKKVKN